MKEEEDEGKKHSLRMRRFVLLFFTILPFLLGFVVMRKLESLTKRRNEANDEA